jgi:hypothetical protein
MEYIWKRDGKTDRWTKKGSIFPTTLTRQEKYADYPSVQVIRFKLADPKNASYRKFCHTLEEMASLTLDDSTPTKVPEPRSTTVLSPPLSKLFSSFITKRAST